MMLPVKAVGSIGVIKDVSANELPINAWTDSSNIRFQNGSALQFYGHSSVYGTPSAAPQYVLPVVSGIKQYWIYPTASKTYVVESTDGTVTETDITHATPRTGVVNQWTGCVFGGIPVLNVGDASKIPMYWDMDVTHKCVDLTSWPAGTYCKALRPFKSMLVAMNLTVGGTKLPHTILISHPADPGSLPPSWDETDTTKDVVKTAIADGDGEIVDGLQLKDDFIVYKERSAHRITYIGGVYVVSSKQIFGMSGLMNRNCAVEFDGYHLAVTSTDIVIHDGYSAESILDNKARRAFFQDIDDTYKAQVFAFKNPYLNEIFIAYPSIGATSCNKAVVYNYKDKTVTYRSLPNINHAAYGTTGSDLINTWAVDASPWDSDLTAWNGPDFTPGAARVIMGSADTKFYMMDASASFDGVIPSAYLERRSLPVQSPERRTLITGIRPVIYGNNGETVVVKIGGSDTDPFAVPTWDATMNHVIGTTIQCDGFANRRYPAIRFETGTAFQWRLDSYQIAFEDAGEW